MSDQPPKTILAQGEQQVTELVAQLAPDEVAKVAAGADTAGVRIGGAVDLGNGFTAGGHVEKSYGGGWGWFVGATKRWFKRK